MLEQDYIMKMLLAFYQALVKSLTQAKDEDRPEEAANTLDEAVSNAVGMDGKALLSLAPESIGTVLQVSGTDPRVSEYVARSLLLASDYFEQAGQKQLSILRREQANAVAKTYGFELPEDAADLSELERLAKEEAEDESKNQNDSEDEDAQ